MRTSQLGVVRDPNVVPMIDVLLVLLIIFMIATPFVRSWLDMQLPQEAEGVGAAPIVLTIAPGPRYTLNGRELTATSLGDEIERTFRGRPQKVLFVKGEPKVRYGEVVHAFDVARGAGVSVSGVILPKRDSITVKR